MIHRIPLIAPIRRRRRHHPATDPLGAGNTALIAAVGVTPLGFWDVRRNLTLATGVSSLADVKGDGTYGPALVQATGTSQPAWDGTYLTTNGTTFLKSASTITGADVSTQLTALFIGDWGATAGKVPWELGNGTVFWRGLINTGLVFRVTTSTNGTGAISTAATGTGNVRVVAMTVNVSATDAETIEVPATAKVTSGTSTALASTVGSLTLGGTFAGTAGSAIKFRAFLLWAGGYTAGQLATVVTWAQTYHAAVLA